MKNTFNHIEKLSIKVAISSKMVCYKPPSFAAAERNELQFQFRNMNHFKIKLARTELLGAGNKLKLEGFLSHTN